jgi:hypothetical protein
MPVERNGVAVYTRCVAGPVPIRQLPPSGFAAQSLADGSERVIAWDLTERGDPIAIEMIRKGTTVTVVREATGSDVADLLHRLGVIS